MREEIIFAGFDGQGIIFSGTIICLAAMKEGKKVTHIPSYGPESRGGTSYADVHIAREEVLSPASPTPNILIAFNAPSLAKFAPAVAPGGTDPTICPSTIFSVSPASR